jgi:transposase
MTKQELVELLKENLEIRISEKTEMYSDDVVVSILFDNELITEDVYQINNKL